MYGDPAKQEKAIENMHMTFEEAAALAREARPKALWLTHYSPSLSDPEAFIGLARNIFPETVPGADGMTATLRFDER